MNLHRIPRTLTITPLESLDERIVPSSVGVASVTAQEALVATRGGPALGAVYIDYVNYESLGGQGAFTSRESGRIAIKGTTVGVDVRFSGGNFKALERQLQGLGMKVTATAPRVGIVEGYVPIANLSVVVSLPHEASTAPIYNPVTYGIRTPAVASPPVVSPSSPGSTLGSGSSASDKGGPALASIYQEYLTYLQGGAVGTFSPPEANHIAISGTSVGLDVRVTGDLGTMVGVLKGLGMQVSATSTAGQVGIIEGYLPIAQLPTVANNGALVGMSPVYKPVFIGPGGHFA